MRTWRKEGYRGLVARTELGWEVVALPSNVFVYSAVRGAAICEAIEVAQGWAEWKWPHRAAPLRYRLLYRLLRGVGR